MPCWGAGPGCVALLGAGGGIFGYSTNKIAIYLSKILIQLSDIIVQTLTIKKYYKYVYLIDILIY